MERSEGIVQLVCKCPPLSWTVSAPKLLHLIFALLFVLRPLQAIVINQFVRFFLFSLKRHKLLFWK